LSGPLSPFQARLLRRATRADLAFALTILGVASLAVWSGNAAARRLSPGGAQKASALLDELELPRTLPNAPLARSDGAEVRLWEEASHPRTLLTFYAPWCKPCQEELPILVNGTRENPAQLVVVVGGDEDPAEVARQLGNLGLPNLRYHVDTTRAVEQGGRVAALPTTFLLGPNGRVHERLVGYSGYRLQTLIWKATQEPSFAGGE
jgi:cytochrome c biogenesis protein CcmG/thiol:disulfide interchange protein DsbE